MYCPFCGTENAKGNTFCIHCGKPLPFVTEALPPQLTRKRNRIIFWVIPAVLLLAALFIWITAGIQKTGTPVDGLSGVAQSVPPLNGETKSSPSNPAPTFETIAQEAPGTGSEDRYVPIPLNLPVITAENAAGIEQIGSWGTGRFDGFTVSPDGKWIVYKYTWGFEIQSSENKQFVSKVQDGTLYGSPKFSIDSSTLILLTREQSDTGVFVYWMDTKKSKKIWSSSGIRATAISSDGSTLVYQTFQINSQVIVKTSTGEVISVEPYNTSDVTDLVYSKDNRYLFVGTQQGKLFRLEFGSSDVLLEELEEPVSKMNISPDGKILSVITTDNILNLFNTETFENIFSKKQVPGVGAVFSSDGKEIADCFDKEIAVWKIEDEKTRRTYPMDESYCLIYFLGQNQLITETRNGSLLLIDLTTGAVSHFLSLSDSVFYIRDIYFSASSKNLYIFRFFNYHAYDIGSGLEIKKGQISKDDYYYASEKWFVSWVNRQTLTVRRLEEDNVIASIPWKLFPYRAEVSDQGRYLAIYLYDQKVLVVFDIKTGKEIYRRLSSANSFKFSPDEKKFVVLKWDAIDVYNAENGKLMTSLPKKSSYGSIVFSPDGQTFAMTGNGRWVEIFQTDSLESDYIEGHPEDTSNVNGEVIYSADGKLLATTTGQNVNIYDLANRKIIAHFQADSIHVNWIRFSPDNRFLVTTGEDGVVRFWGTKR